MRPPFPVVSLLAAALALTACKRTEPAALPAAKVPAATPAITEAAAHDNLNAVLWVQRSAEYRAVSETIYRAAADKLDVALE